MKFNGQDISKIMFNGVELGAVMSNSQKIFSGAKIYGVSWNKTSNPTLTRTDDAVGMAANVGVDSTTVDNDFDTAEIFKDITEVTDAGGNTFVRIPKFYIAKTVGTSETLKISRLPFAGSYLPKCFWDFTNSVELPYFDLGKYVASSADSTKLDSKANTYPIATGTINDYRTKARANGAGYQQFDIHALDVLQALMTVEFATLDTQAIMMGWSNGTGDSHTTVPTATVAETGVNRAIVSNTFTFTVGTPIAIAVNGEATRFLSGICYGRIITDISAYDASNTAITFDGDPVNIDVGCRVYNVGWKNGFSSGVAASSGSIVSNSDGLHPCMYRGIENPYGNTFIWCDGVSIKDPHIPWVCDDADDYAYELFEAPYRQLSYTDSSSSGNVTELGYDGNNPFARFPLTISGTNYTNNYYSTRYYQDTSNRTMPVGGYWGSKRGAGPFCYWPAYKTNRGAMFSARLMRKAV